MAKRHKNERAQRKEVKRLFERSFDTYRLNYPARVKHIKPKALLYGIVTAGVIYTLAYAGAYYGFSNNLVPIEAFAKMVWILMVPTTVAGMLVWMISKNRLEYPVRQDIREYMEELEQEGGLLWRFTPLWEQFDGEPGVTQKALGWSREVNMDKLDIEDYTEAVANLHAILRDHDIKSISDETVNAVLGNFSDDQ